MPGCSAVGCHNRSEKGFLMKVFPKDPKRRAEWTKQMQRANFTPTDRSVLCEMHFEPHMWEKTRQDGSRRLRCNAVPTIFAFSKPKPTDDLLDTNQTIDPLYSPPKGITTPSPTSNITTRSNQFGFDFVKEEYPEIKIELQPLNTSPRTKSTSVSSSNYTTERSSSSCSDTSSDSTENEVFTKIDHKVQPTNIQNTPKTLQKRNLKRRPYIPAKDRYKIERLERQNRYLKEAYYTILRQQKITQNKLKNSRKLRRQLQRKLNKAITNLTEENYAKALKSVFNDDQIVALQKSMKFNTWSNDTIRKAMKLKFACGTNGYLELLEQKIPLPSLRTITRRLENLRFKSGILEEVFDILKLKFEHFENEYAKECGIVLDEMTITASHVYDPTIRSFLGNCTLPESSEYATRAFVVMLTGISTSWRQTVAYYFTGDSVDGQIYEDVLMNIIKRTEEFGLRVNFITSDMDGSTNSLWQIWNIIADRSNSTKNYIIHPFDKNRKIYIIASIPHLYKNFKILLKTDKILNISDVVKEKYNLPAAEINIEHINDVINYQNYFKYVLTPNCREIDYLPDEYQKMKMIKSKDLPRVDVNSALELLSTELDDPAYKTTAWFMNLIDKWYEIMTSNDNQIFCKLSTNKYEETIEFLTEFVRVIEEIVVGSENLWRAVQTGVIISTQSMFDLQNQFLNHKNYGTFLPSRFTQDSLESLFIKLINCKPVTVTALQFKNNLKLISVSQYFAEGTAEKPVKKPEKTNYDEIPMPPDINPSTVTLNRSEKKSLYHIAGYLISSIRKTSKTCDSCISALGTKLLTKESPDFTQLCGLKVFKNTAFFCNLETFDFFIEMEKVFRVYYQVVADLNINLKEFFWKKLAAECKFKVICHNVKRKMISRYVAYRLKVVKKKKCKQNNVLELHVNNRLEQ